MEQLGQVSVIIPIRGYLLRPFLMSYLSAVLYICIALTFSSSANAEEPLRIVSQNMHRLLDNVDDGNNEQVFSNAKFYRKVDTAASIIVNQFALPDILALQEVENRNVLSKITQSVKARSGVRYQIVLLEGNDISSINVAYLIKNTFEIKSVKQLFKHQRLPNDTSLLFSRPPLYLEACIESNCLSLLNLHLRSMRGIRSNTKGKRVRLKRLEQASSIAQWIDDFQQSRPEASLLVLGDFNGLTPSDPYVDVVGTILGKPDILNTQIPATDWIKEDLTDLTRFIDPRNRYSYIYRKKKQILDYMLSSSRFKPRLVDIAFGRINYAFSDHAALIGNFVW